MLLTGAALAVALLVGIAAAPSAGASRPLPVTDSAAYQPPHPSPEASSPPLWPEAEDGTRSYLVELRRGAAHTTLPMVGSRLERTYDHLPFLAVRASAAAAAVLRADPAVLAVEPDMVFPLANEQIAPRAPAAAAQALPVVTGAGWTVAVLDTGVDINHPYLVHKTSAGIDGKGDGGACFALGRHRIDWRL